MTYEAIVGWEQIPQGYVHRDVADVAIDSDDNVYLLTRYDPRVIVYDRAGRFIRSWGENVLSARPHGITAGADGAIYIVDDQDQTVRKFTRDGRQLAVIGTSGRASETGYTEALTGWDRVASVKRASGPFNRPTAVAIAANGHLYVSDGYGNARVHEFSPEGSLIRSWGEPGVGPGQFHLPHHIAIDSLQRLLVSDRENDRIQVLSLAGEFIEEWTNVQRPSAAVIGPEGLVFVAEAHRAVGRVPWMDKSFDRRGPARVTILDGTGKVLRRLGASDAEPCAAGMFAAPHGAAVDSHGDLYVAEVPYSSATRGKNDVISGDCHTFQKLSRRDSSEMTRVIHVAAPSV